MSRISTSGLFCESHAFAFSQVPQPFLAYSVALAIGIS